MVAPIALGLGQHSYISWKFGSTSLWSLAQHQLEPSWGNQCTANVIRQLFPCMNFALWILQTREIFWYHKEYTFADQLPHFKCNKIQDKLSSRSLPRFTYSALTASSACEDQQSLSACSWSTCNTSCTSPVSALLSKKRRPLFAKLPHLTSTLLQTVFRHCIINEFIQLHLDKTQRGSRPALCMSCLSCLSSTPCSLFCQETWNFHVFFS